MRFVCGKLRTAIVCAGLMMIAGMIAPAGAKGDLVFTGATAGNGAGQTNSASVTFGLTGSGASTNLVVTLTNLATYKPNDPPDILTAVFFTVAGDPNFTKVSAILNTGSTGVQSGSTLTVPSGIVGGSWAYASNLSGAPNSANEGIGAAGFGIFGPGDLFPGAALPGDSPTPGGLGGGITTTVDDGSAYNGGVSGRPLVKNSVVFTLSGVPANFQLSSIANVSFGYGTAPDQVVAAVPEPGMIGLCGAIVGLVGVRRKRTN